MKFNYDTVADAMYLFLNKGKVHKSIEIKDGVVLDMGQKGKIIGIDSSLVISEESDFFDTLFQWT